MRSKSVALIVFLVLVMIALSWLLAMFVTWLAFILLGFEWTLAKGTGIWLLTMLCQGNGVKLKFKERAY